MKAPDDNARFALIHELANAFARRLEIDELIPYVLARCREILGASGVSLLLFDPERDQFYFPYVSEGDVEAARRLANFTMPADRGVAGAVFQSGRAELIADAHNDARFFSGVDRTTGTSTGSMVAAPLSCGEARLGVIEGVRRVGEPQFTESDKELLEKLAASVAIAIDNAGRFGQVKASADRLRAEVGALRRELARDDRFSEIIAVSPAMSEVFRMMEAAAASSINVLIEGDTGTGKELVAHAIHRTSARAEAAFVAINCAAMPEGLLESELFGHRRGAFTGAHDDQQGLFKAASGGVLFLDEIGEMPLPMQAKLLRVVQDGEVTSVGDTRPHKVNVRLLSATNRELESALTAGAFRRDLFYRLAAFTIRLPALRDRREDIPLLAARFLDVAARRHGRRIDGFKSDVIEVLANFDWPGNVRQLQNEIERAVALARDGDAISLRLLSPGIVTGVSGVNAATIPRSALPARARERPTMTNAKGEKSSVRPLGDACADFEAGHIADALALHNGNVSRTAAALGVSRVTLQKKMKQYSLR